MTLDWSESLERIASVIVEVDDFLDTLVDHKWQYMNDATYHNRVERYAVQIARALDL